MESRKKKKKEYKLTSEQKYVEMLGTKIDSISVPLKSLSLFGFVVPVTLKVFGVS